MSLQPASSLTDPSCEPKKLARILRYIASMHQVLHAETNSGCSFVRPLQGRWQDTSHFFLHRDDTIEVEDEAASLAAGVLFTTDNFRYLLSLEQGSLSSSLFAFYAVNSTSSPSNKKRPFTGTLQNWTSGRRSSSSLPEKHTTWFRVTRMTKAQLSVAPSLNNENGAVRKYLKQWLENSRGVSTMERLLTLRRISKAPKLPPSTSARDTRKIKSFLSRYKTYLVQRKCQSTLEPIYNRLFEWNQQQNQDHQFDLVWGLGHVRMVIVEDGNRTLLNGPLLEVLVEVALGRDGALLVRPRDHTGVSLNPQVVNALVAASCEGGSKHGVLSQLHRTVAELDPTQLSPGQPNSYVPLLKRIALELSSGGSFQSSATPLGDDAILQKPVVTESWCLYARPKPSSVWARDATAFADQMLDNSNTQSGSFEIPKAAWVLTNGPGWLEEVLKKEENALRPSGGLYKWIKSAFETTSSSEATVVDATITKPLLPLASSESQLRIADLLLTKHYPAVVCAGPPGTGKSHTIANMICAYLCQGKRVLVTSKSAPALSVLKNRLPTSVSELCVDVSMSELSGMRQLQLTVERLANRISCVSTFSEKEKCRYLQQNILALEKELEEIDTKLLDQSENTRQILKNQNGQRFVALSVRLIEESPWLVKSLAKWSLKDIASLTKSVGDLAISETDPIAAVSGYDHPPSDAIISLAACKAGSFLPRIALSAKMAVVSVPIVGPRSGIEEQATEDEATLGRVKLDGKVPESRNDWITILRALKHAKSVSLFTSEIEMKYGRCGWPTTALVADYGAIREFHEILLVARELKTLAIDLNLQEELDAHSRCQSLDVNRGVISNRIKSISAELVDSTVVAELSRQFSSEAQSALIRFAQIAGKAKYSRSSQPSKMTQRQRRRRQEYLDAFDRCCRFIPCWILTTSQISDYLPSECLFDLVICDESSQSDITALPAMLRGKQWLIVGDSKQVSPTECFVAEEQIDALRAALPPTPLESSLMPGQSFFDLCSQAFPRGRVVLNEHFRCAEEIISFSNREFYDNTLVPLRLPKKSERLSPSLVDIKVPKGKKNGKVNELEAEEIVNQIRETVINTPTVGTPRSIGVISLMGDEQSRLIRGRLLDAIGPQAMAVHDILVGDPPTFQGAERDIIYLSMVCSPGASPVQSQVMHFQRANVALSRARDKMVLVRSIELKDLRSVDDIKGPIIEFFESSATSEEGAAGDFEQGQTQNDDSEVRQLLVESLTKQGFRTSNMGAVWKGGICVESAGSDDRAAMILDGAWDCTEEWQQMYKQQKAIERVGWKCLRINELALMANPDRVIASVVSFLATAGVSQPVACLNPDLESIAEDDDVEVDDGPIAIEEDQAAGSENDVQGRVADTDTAIVVSSDDEGSTPEKRDSTTIWSSGSVDAKGDNANASDFGQVVDLSFLRQAQGESKEDDDARSGDDSVDFHGDEEKKSKSPPSRRRSREKAQMDSDSDDSDESLQGVAKRRSPKKYRRLDTDQRDETASKKEEKKGESLDVDPDLPTSAAAESKSQEDPTALATKPPSEDNENHDENNDDDEKADENDDDGSVYEPMDI